MNILIVCLSKLPALLYGGTQRVVWSLAKELARIGEGRNKVYILAKAGSVCDFAEIIERDSVVPLERQIPADVDVVHFQDAVPAGFSAKPYIVTLNGNGIAEPIDRNAVFVSRNHAERFGSESFVYNGLDWDDYGSLNIKGPRTYFHFLGKAAWRVKNVRGCISMIKQMGADERLYVLGGYRFNFKMGWRFTFTPKARFKGMVGGEEKVGYLQHSRGLLFPVLWDEPFGLAITESLYCGCPIFGTPYGSLPELVTPEVGFLSRSEGKLVEHIENDYHYSPKACHEYARDMFNSRRMAEAYMKKYEQVLNEQPLNAERPHPINPFSRYVFEK